MKTQTPNTYQAAKSERTAYILDWMVESLTAEPACSGWARSALLLVINHSLISEAEKEEEKRCINKYTSTQAYQRRFFWQSIIEFRQSKQLAKNGKNLCTAFL